MGFSTSELIFLISIGVLFVFLLIFLIWYSNSRKKQIERIVESFNHRDDEYIKGFYKGMTQTLENYTQDVLVPELQSNYQTLVERDLLPSVNQAVTSITNLNEKVINKQEEELTLLAQRITDKFTSTMSTALKGEMESLNSLNRTASDFSTNLSNIQNCVKDLAGIYESIAKQTNILPEMLSKSASVYENSFSQLTESVDSTRDCLVVLQDNVKDSGKVFEQLTTQTQKIQDSSKEFAQTVSDQNLKSVELIEKAANSFSIKAQENTTAMAQEIASLLEITNEQIRENAASLSNVSTSIDNSSNKFVSTVADTNEIMSEKMSEAVKTISQTVADSAQSEYLRIIETTKTYSNGLADHSQALENTLGEFMSNLKTISNHLVESASSIHAELEGKSSMFESDMQKTVASVLKELDESLSTITGRLVSVTANIKEASDYIPAALKHSKE